jgi:hypothetical protein
MRAAAAKCSFFLRWSCSVSRNVGSSRAASGRAERPHDYVAIALFHVVFPKSLRMVTWEVRNRLDRSGTGTRPSRCRSSTMARLRSLLNARMSPRARELSAARARSPNSRSPRGGKPGKHKQPPFLRQSCGKKTQLKEIIRYQRKHTT